MSEVKVVSFYDSNGLVPAWNLAEKFAGQNGRVATLPDIIEIRLNSKSEDLVWNNWFTTNTAEYFGIGKDGKKKIIVAHGIGPMSNLKGILKAYSYEFKDKTRKNRGGRISQKEFLKLESGQYGSVSVLDFDQVMFDFAIFGIQYPFIESLDHEQCYWNGLLRARLGHKAEDYINLHSEITRENNNDENPKLIELGNANNCGYLYQPLEEGLAIAHLISIGQLINVTQSGGSSSLRTDISCHEWSNSNKFIGIRKDTKLDKIDKCVDANNLLKNNWQQLMVPVETPVYPGAIRRIIEREGQEFVEYQKKGSSLDTGEPEFHVISKEPIGELMVFQTTTGGSDFFFRYDQKEISTIAPPDSNAYEFLGEIGTIYENNKPKFHTRKIQFYRAEIDYSQRLIHASQLANDYDKMIELIDK